MTAGNHILLARVHSILPIHWRRRGFMFHTALSILRFIIGVVDVVLIKISIYEDGTCEYRDEEFVSLFIHFTHLIGYLYLFWYSGDQCIRYMIPSLIFM